MLPLNDFVQTIKAVVDAQRQNARLLKLVFPHDDGPVGALLVAHRLDADEGLSRDFQYTIEVLSDTPAIPLETVIGKMVTIALQRDDGSLRYFNGHVFEFGFVRHDAGFSYYRMVLRPWLAFLHQRRNNFIFHGKTLEEQSRHILEACPMHDWRIRELGPDEVMTDAVQFDESDHNYLHRRWEAQGWTYWYDHRADGHTLVLCGDSRNAQPIDGGGRITWEGRSGLTPSGIWQFAATRRVIPTHYTAASFDFKAPRPRLVDVPSINQQGQAPALEIYDYAGAYGFKDAPDGDRLARQRLEEREAGAKCFAAEGDEDHVQPGRSFTLAGHADLQPLGSSEGDREFLIIDVRHTITNNYETQQGDMAEYRATFTCLHKRIPWRPGRGYRSHEPKIYGLQTALVVGPAGQEIHTDEYGRVRVQFHWDRVGAYDDRSSAWVRVATALAGENYGQIALPRVGQEVLVQFLDGNPDRPLITGRVHNADNRPPHFSHTGSLPANHALSGWSTRELHGRRLQQLRFDDTPGEIGTQLASEHGHTALNQGWLGHPRHEGAAPQRGEGFELRSDLAGAIRAAQGLLITTDAQPKAHGDALARQELIGQLEAALAIAGQLADLAATHAAGNADRQPAEALARCIEDWQAPGGAPAIAVSAPAGLALASAEAITAASGTTLDLTAAQDTHLSTGRKLLLHAGQGLAAFAHKAGMKLIAAAGKLSLQAQSDEMELIAAKLLRLVSLESVLVESGRGISLRSGGAQITLADGKIILAAANGVEVQAPSFNFGKGAGGQADIPDMPTSSLATDERPAFGTPFGKGVPAVDYETRNADGAIEDVGQSGGDGAGERILAGQSIEALKTYLTP